MSLPLLTVRVASERDVVLARRRARDVAELLGFEPRHQTGIATAVSEIVRNAFRYAGGGSVAFSLEPGPPRLLLVRVRDEGPGIPHLDAVLGGRYRSPTGMGLGIVGARRLSDTFRIESEPGRGTEVVFGKELPRTAPPPTEAGVARIAAELARRAPEDPLVEVEHQNRELLETLGELRARQEEIARVNAELEDTNRGVLALYAELDEKAESLRRASEVKTRFLSNMTHEFRTPLNAVLSLAGLLLDRTDGDLTPEQERQVTFIRRSAEELSTLVNDLLDIAKVEAGKIDVHPTDFEAGEMFGGLKGVFRPLAQSAAVALVFDEPSAVPPLHTDEGKVSQILRNFISNALKFTERGEVRVSAAPGPGGTAVFSVADTGVGIAPADQERIFEEFTQVASPLQRRVKGTGLGLPLSRRLAELLGGRVSVESAPGEGSTFRLEIPARYAARGAREPSRPGETAAARAAVLVVDASDEALDDYEAWLEGSAFRAVRARTLDEARGALAESRPVAVVMDVLLQGESAWGFLAELKGDDATRDIPVLVVTIVENRAQALALGAEEFARKPVDRAWLVERVSELARARRTGAVLAVDDDEVSRYLLRELLSETGLRVLEAADGAEGLAKARELRPDAIFLDLIMPGMGGGEVLDALEADPATRDVPVIIYTSELLDEERRRALEPRVAAILVKEEGERAERVARIRGALEASGLSLPDAAVEPTDG